MARPGFPVFALLFGMLAAGMDAQAAGPDDMVYLDLKDGRVVIEMRPDLAPRHVARIKELVGQGFYDGLPFHRVMDGFMAQTGDPRGDGTGGSGVKIPAEFSDEPYERGTLGMARSSDPDSADSQFFIMFKRNPSLDGEYTVWGKVVEGMDYVDKIKKAPPGARSGTVDKPDRIVRMRMAVDVKDDVKD